MAQPLADWWGVGPSWDARRIYAPRFHTSGALHLCWRIFLAVYSISVSIENTVLNGGPRYLSYLTNQGIWLTVSYFVFSALASLVVYFIKGAPTQGGKAWRHLEIFIQLLFSIALPMQLVIVVLYWLLLAAPQVSALRTWDNLESHGIKFALIWSDLLVGSMVLPRAQVIVTLGCAGIYILINLAVTLSTGIPVYSVLKWKDASSGILVGGSMVFVIVAFFLGRWISVYRDALALARRKKRVVGGQIKVEEEGGEEDSPYPSRFRDDEEGRKLPHEVGCCRRNGGSGGDGERAALLHSGEECDGGV